MSAFFITNGRVYHIVMCAPLHRVQTHNALTNNHRYLQANFVYYKEKLE